ncbi:MAG: hypothetical protein U1F24_03850 [Alphaproteobacteria bacterium]
MARGSSCSTVAAMAARTPFKGVLYAGLILTAEGPKLIEYNARFGDPETQVLMPRLTSDLVPILMAAAEGRLAGVTADWRDETALTVVMAAKGYPGGREGVAHRRAGGGRGGGRSSFRPARGAGPAC